MTPIPDDAPRARNRTKIWLVLGGVPTNCFADTPYFVTGLRVLP
jgi:hypothetical protein